VLYDDEVLQNKLRIEKLIKLLSLLVKKNEKKKQPNEQSWPPGGYSVPSSDEMRPWAGPDRGYNFRKVSPYSH
jgi:hypothetical protein